MATERNIRVSNLFSLSLLTKFNRDRILSLEEMLELRVYLLEIITFLDTEINDGVYPR